MDFLIHHMLRRSTERFPAKEALVHKSERLDYAQLSRRVAGIAQALRDAGLKRGERVGIYLEASVPQVVSYFGVSQAGGIFVTINSLLFPNQVQHIANDCTMTALITSQSKLKGLQDLLPNLPSLRFLIVLSDGTEPVETILPQYGYEKAIETIPHSPWNDWCIGKDLAGILYTSGSTGRPKGVMLSHENVMAGATIVSDYLGISDKERILAVLPFSFDAGMNQMTTAIQQGATLVLINWIFAKEVVTILLKERITGLAGVPTFWSLMAQPNSGLSKQPLPDLRYITNTGGAMPQNVLAVLRKHLTTTKIFLMYGLTEAFRSTYLPPEELDCRPTSMGRAIPNNEMMVIKDDGTLAGPGEIGELVHRGATVSYGYWNNPEATNRVLRPNPLLPKELGDCERVCYSGDLVRIDEEGFLYFVGRRDTMIKSSGYRISPTEVEEALFASGKIRHAAVIGIPDDVLGQAIKAFVTPKDGDSVDMDALIQYCSEKMPRYMVPKTIEVVKELPKTSSGKVDYPALRRGAGVA